MSTIFAKFIGKGVNKKSLLFADMSTNGGGVNPLSTTKISCFFFQDNKMKNVLKRKNMCLEGIQGFLIFFLSKSYVLDYAYA